MQLWNPIICVLLVMLSSAVICEDDTSTENNEIIPKKAIKDIDDTVRQALLRAIDKLEKQAAEKYSSNEDTSPTEDDEEPEVQAKVQEISTASSSADEILEESTTSDVAPTVQFFTATFDERLSEEQPLLSFINKDKQFKKKVVSNLNLGSPDIVNATSATNVDSRQATRSIASDRTNEISSDNKAEIQFEITKVKKKPVPTTTTVRTTTTSTTTTTTTPRPTHNEDGENIELVDKDDIKIQAAPLVSAFTVDLDERGAAKNVIPIIDRLSTTKKPEATEAASSHGPTIARLNVLPSGVLLPTPLPSENVLQYRTNEVSNANPPADTRLPVSNSLRADLALQQQQLQQQQQQPTDFPLVNNYLIERQRALEQQIYQLQLQAKQQQEQITRQLQLLEQSQQRQQQNQQQLPPQNILPPLATSTTQRNQNPSNGFTIRPSIEFVPSSENKPSNNFAFASSQQLPVKEPTKFNAEPNNNLFAPVPNNNVFGANNNNNNGNGNLVFTPNGNPNVFATVNANANANRLQPQQTSIQIQPSSQLAFIPSVQQQALVTQPPELSPFQNLPQNTNNNNNNNNYRVFQNLPFLSGNNNLLQQQQQQLQQQQQQLQQQQQQLQQLQRTRQFRQESGTGNFGLNQLTPSQNQNFYRQQLTPANSNQLQSVAAAYQSALNHGINPYTPQNLRYQPGQGGF